METNTHLWIKRLAIGAATVALPAAALAHDPAGHASADTCTAPLPPHGGMMPPSGLFPEGVPPRLMPPPPGLMPRLPSLRGVELSDAQEDSLFKLLLAQAPLERAKAKEAITALNDLRRLATSDHFDSERARTLAETHALAVAQLALMHAELDTKVRAMLTPEQRKQVDTACGNTAAQRTAAKGS